MKKFIFYVRPWNVDFFLSLQKKIKESHHNTSIEFWTMQIEAFLELKRNGVKAIYLPDCFELCEVDENLKNTIEDKMIDRFSFGVNYLFEIERFKPEREKQHDFMWKQVGWIYEKINESSLIVSLTCDHFVYIITSYISSLKKSRTLFLQPIGFLNNANVLTRNLWEIEYFRKQVLPLSFVDEYINSLSLPPSQSIHYMKERNSASLLESFSFKFKKIRETHNKKNKSVFSYLEKKHTFKLIPSRFTKRKLPAFLNHHSLSYFTNNYIRIFYFPLQYEPEMSILGYSPFYKNQLEVVRLISQSLNKGDILILKENPKMIGNRLDDFYKEASSYHNVKWIVPSENSREIIRKSYKVVSITGTATIEAASLGIPSMIFGYPPFHSLLIQSPVSDLPLSNFRSELYKTFSKDDITQHLRVNWDAFSKAVFFGDFIPRFDGVKHTTINTDELADSFYDEVLTAYIYE